jgi:hypothetical protein
MILKSSSGNRTLLEICSADDSDHGVPTKWRSKSENSGVEQIEIRLSGWSLGDLVVGLFLPPLHTVGDFHHRLLTPDMNRPGHHRLVQSNQTAALDTQRFLPASTVHETRAAIATEETLQRATQKRFSSVDADLPIWIRNLKQREYRRHSV